MDLHYSQTWGLLFTIQTGFTTLWIYTILKHSGSAGRYSLRFTTLWIYTILKLQRNSLLQIVSFTTLWIYTILKLTGWQDFNNTVSLPYGFTLFSNKETARPHLF